MSLIKPSYEILTPISEGGKEELKFIENIARTCYKSEDKISEDSYLGFIKRLIVNDHTAMIEHSMLSVKFICDRGVANELVRHRHSSFAQESTRYCNYSKDKFWSTISVVDPIFFAEGTHAREIFDSAMEFASNAYFHLLDEGYTPEQARIVLPIALKTEIVVTANYREWRNIFKLRCSPAAHPQMRELMIPLRDELKKKLPIIFDDL